jgi:hypothetical protein
MRRERESWSWLSDLLTSNQFSALTASKQLQLLKCRAYIRLIKIQSIRPFSLATRTTTQQPNLLRTKYTQRQSGGSFEGAWH